MGSGSSNPKKVANDQFHKNASVNVDNIPPEEIQSISRSIDACSMITNAKTIEPVIADTVSMSTQIYASFSRNKSMQSIFMKIWLTPTIKMLRFDNSLYVEVVVYKHVVPVLLESSPFFVDFVGFQTCPNFIETTEDFLQQNNIEYERKAETMMKQINALLQKTQHLPSDLYKKGKFPSLDFLLTEHITNAILFRQWILPGKFGENKPGRFIKRSLKDTKDLIFQMLWNFDVMQKAEIRHNDLHLDNILIKQLDTPQTFHFMIIGEENANNTYFTMTTKVMVKIFDWDHAGSDYIYNSALYDADTRLCDNGFGCGEFQSNPGFDAYKFGALLEEFLKSNSEEDVYARATFSSDVTSFFDKIINVLNTNPSTRKPIRPPFKMQEEWKTNLEQPEIGKFKLKPMNYRNPPLIKNRDPLTKDHRPWVELPLHFDFQQMLITFFPDYIVDSGPNDDSTKIYKTLGFLDRIQIMDSITADQDLGMFVSSP